MSDTAAEILEFMRAMERVCLVKRDTLLSDGTPENDAAHIFKLAILITYICKQLNLDTSFCHFKLCNMMLHL